MKAQEAIARVVALAAVGAGNEAAQVHASAIKVLGDGKGCATTARDEEHAEALLLVSAVPGWMPPGQVLF